MPDISFDENYMGYYDEQSGQFVDPDDPRDDEGIGNFQEYWSSGDNARGTGGGKSDRWKWENETLPLLIKILGFYIGYKVLM